MKKMQEEIEKLTLILKQKETQTLKSFKVETLEDKEHQSCHVNVQVKSSTKTKKFKLTSYFFGSPEFNNLINYWEGIKKCKDSHFRIEKK